MGSALSTGACNSCHGPSTGKLGLDWSAAAEIHFL
jgi:mono/diheme cytochrome c family protein